MQFKPKRESELMNLLPKGEYDFEIMEAADKISKSGNEMIELRVAIWKDEDVVSRIFDHLMEKVAYKLRHCAEACGIIDLYETGNLKASDFEGRTGKCKLDVQKDTTGQYLDKNVVKDYLPRPNGAQEAGTDRLGMLPSERAAENNDSLPF